MGGLIFHTTLNWNIPQSKKNWVWEYQKVCVIKYCGFHIKWHIIVSDHNQT